jgi:hypothetical protein
MKGIPEMIVNIQIVLVKIHLIPQFVLHMEIVLKKTIVHVMKITLGINVMFLFVLESIQPIQMFVLHMEIVL